MRKLNIRSKQIPDFLLWVFAGLFAAMTLGYAFLFGGSIQTGDPRVVPISAEKIVRASSESVAFAEAVSEEEETPPKNNAFGEEKEGNISAQKTQNEKTGEKAGEKENGQTAIVGSKAASNTDDIALCPGGMPFGLRISTDGVLVVGVSEVATDKGNIDPGRKAGVSAGDVIVEVDGARLDNSRQLCDAATASDGAPLTLKLKREGEYISCKIEPAFCESEKEWRLGLWVKDKAAGIGTVTFVNPENQTFAGLGHGICDSDTGVLMPMREGSAYCAEVTGVRLGKSGEPGELRGLLQSEWGSIFKNSTRGVCGKYEIAADDIAAPLKICKKGEVKAGNATILCTTDGKKPKEYDVKLSELNDGGGYRDMVVEITDKALLAETGGIVQGMSGSPIIQNGRLVGAVTHVLVDDPKRGYGIFIENMLSEMPEIYASA